MFNKLPQSLLTWNYLFCLRIYNLCKAWPEQIVHIQLSISWGDSEAGAYII